MIISYKKLWITLIKKDITKTKLRENIGISTSTLSKLAKNKYVSMEVLVKICNELNCDIGDIVEMIKE